MTNAVIRATLEPDVRIGSHHPHIESIVQKQIRQDGADYAPYAKGNFSFEPTLARERGLSLRQAYPYVESARTIVHALPIGEPSAPATFTIPRDVLAQLTAFSARSGLSSQLSPAL